MPVEPKYEPCPGNAPGPFYVARGGCASCDAPLAEAPDLMDYEGEPGFQFHCRFARQPQTEGEVEQAVNAMAVCCTLAVRYGGSDKVILDRLSVLHSAASCDYLPESNGLSFPPNPS